MIIDAHCHLPPICDYPDTREAADCLSKEMEVCGVDRAVVLNMGRNDQEFMSAINGHGNMRGVLQSGRRKDMRNLPECAAFHVHFRSERVFFGVNHMSHYMFSVCDEAMKRRIPVVLDAFPDGLALRNHFNPNEYAKLACLYSDVKFVITHMGGHKVLDFLMLAKRQPNMYFDCSFSPMYYRGSGVPYDIAYAIKSLNYRRVMYGSDYPEFAMDDHLRCVQSLFDASDLPMRGHGGVFQGTAQEVFNWHE